MDFEQEIKNAVQVLTGDGTFTINQILYDEKNFGNVTVVLTSNTNISIRFIKDRGNMWCEVGLSGQSPEWFWLNDVLTAVGIGSMSEVSNFIELVTNTVLTLRQNLGKLIEAFDEKHLTNTRKKLKDIATKRMMAMFNRNGT